MSALQIHQNIHHVSKSSKSSLWAAFEKIAQNIDFLSRVLVKTEQKKPKISGNNGISKLVWAAGWPPLL
jgi:hypothetical protein